MNSTKEPKNLTLVEAQYQRGRQGRYERYMAVVDLGRQGNTQLQIAEKVGVGAKTVARWLHAPGFPELHSLDPFSRRSPMPNPQRLPPKWEVLQQQGTLNPRAQDVTHPLFQQSAFFDPQDLLQVKYEMLRQVRAENQTVRHAALAFGFSRPSFHQAQAAFEQGGLPGLLPRKRGPQHAHKLTAAVMKFLAQARAAEPALSAPELAQQVAKHFGVRVHPRTIERRLRRPEKKRRRSGRFPAPPRRGQ
jgi:transposase